MLVTAHNGIVAVPREVLEHGGNHATPVPPGGAMDDHTALCSGHRLEDTGQQIREQPCVVGIGRRVVQVGHTEPAEFGVCGVFGGRLYEVEAGQCCSPDLR